MFWKKNKDFFKGKPKSLETFINFFCRMNAGIPDRVKCARLKVLILDNYPDTNRQRLNQGLLMNLIEKEKK